MSMTSGYTSPQGGFQSVPLGDVIRKPEYTQSIAHAYHTTMDLSRDLNAQIPKFSSGAKVRIESLIRIIQDLRWQLQQAQQQVIIANLQLHDVLRGGILDESLETYKAGEEYDIRVFGNRQGSKLFSLLKSDSRALGEWRWEWKDPENLLGEVEIGAADQAAKKTAVETAVGGLGGGDKLGVNVLDAGKANDNRGLLATAVVLAYLEAKEKDTEAEWQVTSVLAKDWMGKKLKDSESGVTIDVYLAAVKNTLFPAAGTPGIAAGTPGIAAGTPGIAAGTPGIAAGTPGIAAGTV